MGSLLSNPRVTTIAHTYKAGVLIGVSSWLVYLPIWTQLPSPMNILVYHPVSQLAAGAIAYCSVGALRNTMTHLGCGNLYTVVASCMDLAIHMFLVSCIYIYTGVDLFTARTTPGLLLCPPLFVTLDYFMRTPYLARLCKGNKHMEGFVGFFGITAIHYSLCSIVAAITSVAAC